MSLLEKVKIKKSDEKTFEKILANWTVLQPKLKTLTEEQLLAAMLYERQKKNRLNILQRLYSRFSAIRSERERREVLYGGDPVPASNGDA